ncbi:MAG: hypothetical protein HZA08_01495 [Nitrospirae bacterium]|nr:hypothetical protein [Nitrospirota bacterium]
MPNILEIDKDLYNALVESFGEVILREKIDDILFSAIESRLAKFNNEILKFEEKYGLPFYEFERNWDEDKIQDKHSYEVESDFMDWEMLGMEKKELLSALTRLKGVKKK